MVATMGDIPAGNGAATDLVGTARQLKDGSYLTSYNRSPFRGKGGDKIKEAFFSLIDQGLSMTQAAKTVGISYDTAGEWNRARKRESKEVWSENEENRIEQRTKTIHKMWSLIGEFLTHAQKQAKNATFKELMIGIGIMSDKVQMLSGQPTNRTSFEVSVVADQLEERTKRAAAYLSIDAEARIVDETQSAEVLLTSSREVVEG